MGPALATQNATNGLAWAQPWSPRMLLTVLHGPSAAPHSTLPMLLHGPSPGHPACYRWSCMGPVLAPMHATEGLVRTQCCPPQRATDDLAQVQPWPPSVLLTVLCGPSTCPNACERWSCMGPTLATEHATDGLV